MVKRDEGEEIIFVAHLGQERFLGWVGYLGL